MKISVCIYTHTLHMTYIVIKLKPAFKHHLFHPDTLANYRLLSDLPFISKPLKFS